MNQHHQQGRDAPPAAPAATDPPGHEAGRARRLLSAYNDMAEMIRLGAYRRGSDPLVDRARQLEPVDRMLLVAREAQLDEGHVRRQELIGLAPRDA